MICKHTVVTHILNLSFLNQSMMGKMAENQVGQTDKEETHSPIQVHRTNNITIYFIKEHVIFNTVQSLTQFSLFISTNSLRSSCIHPTLQNSTEFPLSTSIIHAVCYLSAVANLLLDNRQRLQATRQSILIGASFTFNNF